MESFLVDEQVGALGSRETARRWVSDILAGGSPETPEPDIARQSAPHPLSEGEQAEMIRTAEAMNAGMAHHA